MNRILVTGATGPVGSHLVHVLRGSDRPVRAFVRDRDAARRTLGPDVELAVGDYADPGSVAAALDGVDQVFLTCANHPLQVSWETTLVDAAAAAGVRRVVKQSALGAVAGSPVAFFDANAHIDAHLQASGLVFVLLKPAFKMSNLFGAAEGVATAGAIFLPGAGARIAMIDPRDVAEVAAAVLTGDGHDGRSYELTGPEAITFDDVAEGLSDAVGRPIGFVPVPDDAAVAQLVAAGAPVWYATNVVTQFRLLRGGSQAEAQDVVRVLTEHEPRALAQFLRDHRTVFAPRVGAGPGPR